MSREMLGLEPAGRSELVKAGVPNSLVARGLRDLFEVPSRERASVHFDRGVLAHEKQDYKVALEQFDFAIQLEPRNANAYLHRAECLRQCWKCDANGEKASQDLDEVIQLCDEAIRANATNGTAYIHRAMAWIEKHDRAFYLGCGEELKEFFADNASRSSEEALKLLDQWVRSDPENADHQFLRFAALSFRAWCSRNGVYRCLDVAFKEQAMAALANAVRLDPANPRYQLLSGNVDEAIRLEPKNSLYDVSNSFGSDFPWIGGWDIGEQDEVATSDFAYSWFVVFRVELYKKR